MMKQILERLVAVQEQMIAKMKAEMETNQEQVMAKMKTEMRANNEKFEVLRGTLTSRKNIHQARTESTAEEMKAKIDTHQEKMEAAILSIWSKLEETI
jgi:uncharacterized coiled-coil protein SlyX